MLFQFLSQKVFALTVGFLGYRQNIEVLGLVREVLEAGPCRGQKAVDECSRF